MVTAIVSTCYAAGATGRNTGRPLLARGQLLVCSLPLSIVPLFAPSLPGFLISIVNLLFIAVIEAEATQMNLTGLRGGELFPLTFDDCDPTDADPEHPAAPFGLPSDLVQPPAASTSWPTRVQAFEASLLKTFKPDDARSLSSDLADFLQHQKGGGPPPKADASLAGRG